MVLGVFGNVQAYNNIIVGNKYGLSCMRCRQRYSNNLVWGNHTDFVRDAGPGNGDVNRDPRFVNPGEGDYRLSADSPAIDAGRDAGEPLDAAGSARAGDGPDIGAFEFGAAGPSLVINEVMANPLTERSGEYVELINISDAPVDIAGHLLDDGDATDEIIAAGGGTELAAGGIAVILDRDFAGDYEIPEGALRLSVANARLGNSLSVGDPVRLLSPDRVTVVSSYSHPFDPGNGVSAERLTPEADDVAASWTSSPCGATPGRVNCTVEPIVVPGLVALTITEVMANPLDEGTGEYVEVKNTGDEAIDLTALILSDGDDDDEIRSEEHTSELQSRQ